MTKTYRPAATHRLTAPALRMLQATLAVAFAAGALVSMPSRAELTLSLIHIFSHPVAVTCFSLVVQGRNC